MNDAPSATTKHAESSSIAHGLPRVTLVICSHNGARHLPRTLAALVHNARRFREFELLIVDSASTEELLSGSTVTSHLDDLRRLGIPVRCERSEQTGLTTARRLGAQQAQSDLLCFLDDDNAIRDDYLHRGLTYFDNDQCGVLISRVHPRFASSPPPAIARRQHLLAINESLGDSRITWPATDAWCPTLGAGLWIRRTLFLDIYGDLSRALLPDRTGRQLLSGGDIEMGIWAGRLGYYRTYAPDVELDHDIPAERLKTWYFVRLITGVIRSQATLFERYGLRPIGQRWLRWLRLPAYVGAAAIRAAWRPDPVREFVFIVAAEWAECRGPLR